MEDIPNKIKNIIGIVPKVNLVEKDGNYTSANLPEPEIREEVNGFLLVIHKYDGGSEKSSEKIPETTQKSPRNVPEKSQKILNALKENPYLSRKQLALNLGESEYTIQSQLRKLQKEGIIKRIGPAKGGKWEVVSEGNIFNFRNKKFGR